MKSYTDIEQSKKLAEILPIESADMNYWCGERIRIGGYRTMDKDLDIPCWSLTALLECLPTATLDTSEGPDKQFRLHCEGHFSEWRNNPVDVCYETIIRLHENNLL